MAQTKAQREARRQIAQQDRITNAAMKAAFKTTRSLRAEARRLWADGIDPSARLNERSVEYSDSIFDAMVTGFSDAWFSAYVRAAKSKQASGLAFAIPGLHGDALAFVEQRATLLPAQIEVISQAYSTEAATITGTIGTDLEHRVSMAFTQATAEGLHVREGAKLLDDAFIKAGVMPQNPYLLDTIMRTQTATAYGAGRWKANEDPAIQEILWGYEYSTAGDDRVRLEHAALEGVTLPKDDPQWATITPPNGWNCRCTLLEVYHTDKPEVLTPPTDKIEIEGEVVTPGPDSRWAHHPINSIGESPNLGDTPAVGTPVKTP